MNNIVDALMSAFGISNAGAAGMDPALNGTGPNGGNPSAPSHPVETPAMVQAANQYRPSNGGTVVRDTRAYTALGPTSPTLATDKEAMSNPLVAGTPSVDYLSKMIANRTATQGAQAKAAADNKAGILQQTQGVADKGGAGQNTLNDLIQQMKATK